MLLFLTCCTLKSHTSHHNHMGMMGCTKFTMLHVYASHYIKQCMIHYSECIGVTEIFTRNVYLKISSKHPKNPSKSKLFAIQYIYVIREGIIAIKKITLNHLCKVVLLIKWHISMNFFNSISSISIYIAPPSITYLLPVYQIIV